MRAVSGKNPRSGNFSVRVEIARRTLNGRGYVQFHDSQVAETATSEIESFNIEKKIGNGRKVRAEVLMSPHRRQVNQTYLDAVPEWANPVIVKNALLERLRRFKFHKDAMNMNVVLLRNPPPNPIECQRISSDFRGYVALKVTESGEVTLRDFEIHIKEPNDKDFNYVAFLKFDDPDKAAKSADILDGLKCGTQEIEARLDMKAAFVVSEYTYGLCKNDVEEEVKFLNKVSAGLVNVELTRRQNGSYLIQIEASELEDLKEARRRLDVLINGHRIDLESKKCMLMTTKSGLARKEEIQRKARVRIRIDNRQETVFIYGKRESVTRAEVLLNEFLNKMEDKSVKCIDLRDGGYPRGIMKELVLKHGPNLEKLKKECDAVSLDLNLKGHKINFYGSNESYKKLNELIEKVAELLPGPRIQPHPAPDCAICFTNVDYNDCYVLEYCGHFYCTDCAVNLIKNGLSGGTGIPIRCAVDGCGQDLVLKDFQNLLPNIEVIVDPALRFFMANCNKEYAYCTSPDCPMIYRKNENVGEEFVCGECNISICTKCDSTYHPGMTCEVYARFFVKADTVIKAWLLGDLVRRALCSNCGVGIEKNEGCNHVECQACKTHICWVCKKHFNNSGSCYQHLKEKHGGYV